MVRITHDRFLIAIVFLLTLIVMSTTVLAASAPKERRVIDPRVVKSIQYAFPGEPPILEGTAKSRPKLSLGVADRTSSPGALVGVTWYDHQSNGSIGRMVTSGAHGLPDTGLVHFSWMYLPGPTFDDRSYRYRPYNLTNSAWGAGVNLQDANGYGGFVGIDHTNDNRAVVGGHARLNIGADYSPTVYWDSCAGCSHFNSWSQSPDSVSMKAIWPKFRYVEGPTDTVLHVLALNTAQISGDLQALIYFRRIGADNDPNASWDWPPYVVDSIHTVSQDIDATDDGKVGIVWTANLPCSAADPDTASGYECRLFPPWDNDIYYQVSHNYGTNWEPRVNITTYIETEGVEDSFRAFADASVLIDSNDDLHVVWHGRFWPKDAFDGDAPAPFRGKMFHWSENHPVIRVAHDFNWNQKVCTPGWEKLQVGRFSLSECNDRLYIVFTQFNDGPSGVYDDCATPNNPGFPQGSANGDIWVTVSDNGGYSWDPARNLTNSYSPGCDSIGGLGGPCESDVWPSSASHGSNIAAATGDETAEVVVPAGGNDNGWYLDVQYIDDPSAGSVIQNEGFWQQANVRWFRLACVAPIKTADAHISNPTVFGAFGQCSTVVHEMTITNNGTADLTYTVSIEEDPGAYSGWLTVGGFSGFVPYGPGNSETVTIRVNENQSICGDGYDRVSGRVILESNAPTSPDTIPVEVYFSPVPTECWPDTVSTTCLSLVAKNNASVGNTGAGGVNMDFSGSIDCDPSADVYLYDASPLVGRVDGADTVMNFSVFGNWVTTPYGFLPLDCPVTEITDDYEKYTARVMTRDSSLVLERSTYAPLHPDTCRFAIQTLRVYSYDSIPDSNITIGEVIDWDIPSDSGLDNRSGFDVDRNMIYQFGGEYGQDDYTECTENDARYGGVRVLGIGKVADFQYTSFYPEPLTAFTVDNATYVYGNDFGLDPDQYYGLLDSFTGFRVYTSTDPDSQLVDLHTGIAYLHQYDLGLDTVFVATALISVYDGGLSSLQAVSDAANEWAIGHGLNYCIPTCCELRGDANGSGIINVADLTYLVDFFFRGGPAPVNSLDENCPEQGDVNSTGTVGISDLTYLVDYLFSGGPDPFPCSGKASKGC